MLLPLDRSPPVPPAVLPKIAPRPHRRRRVLALALVLVSGGATLVRYALRDPAPRYETTPIRRGSLVARVTATGTVAAMVTVLVGSQVSGRIQSLGADFNSRVKKGTVLARLDPEICKAALDEARANLAAARGALARSRARSANASRYYRRTQTLVNGKLIAGAELDRAQADAAAERADTAAAGGTVEQARAAVRRAEINLAYTTITSPVEGVVISRNVDVGQTVAASLQAPILFTIAGDLRKMEVHTSVPEADVGKLRAGMAGRFTVDAFPGRRFQGEVREIRNASQVQQNVVTYDAVITVDNADLALRPGMTANVTLTYAERSDVLTVANEALRFRLKPGQAEPPEGRRRFWVLRGDKLDSVTVRTGLTDGTFTEIVEGHLVRAGDLAVVDIVTKGNTRPVRIGRVL
jgi:HlyD family secretion protein